MFEPIVVQDHGFTIKVVRVQLVLLLCCLGLGEIDQVSPAVDNPMLEVALEMEAIEQLVEDKLLGHDTCIVLLKPIK